jgi:GR25 family glycosyltransferase involved in LPS biosynthesis
MSALLKNILYINLENRTDRQAHVTEEFKKLGVEQHAERVNAVKLENGGVGCTLSHIKCIQIAKERNWDHVFICEDDITFLNPSLFLENLKKFEESSYVKNADVVIIGGNNCPPYIKLTDYCIQVSNIQTTTGYIVMKPYYDKLLSNFKDGLREFMRNPTNKRQLSIDMYWKRLQSIDKWYMIIPATVTQYGNHSDIENEYKDYTFLMTDLDKPWIMSSYKRTGLSFL